MTVEGLAKWQGSVLQMRRIRLVLPIVISLNCLVDSIRIGHVNEGIYRMPFRPAKFFTIPPQNSANYRYYI